MKKTAIILATLLTSACASQPWSEVNGDWSNPTDTNNFDVVITGIDGKLKFENRKRETFEPGLVTLRFSSERPARTKADENASYNNKTVEMNLKPCVRYYVSAQHKNVLSGNINNWDVVVLKEEPIKSCQKLLNKKPEELTSDSKLSI